MIDMNKIVVAAGGGGGGETRRPHGQVITRRCRQAYSRKPRFGLQRKMLRKRTILPPPPRATKLHTNRIPAESAILQELEHPGVVNIVEPTEMMWSWSVL